MSSTEATRTVSVRGAPAPPSSSWSLPAPQAKTGSRGSRYRLPDDDGLAGSRTNRGQVATLTQQKQGGRHHHNEREGLRWAVGLTCQARRRWMLRDAAPTEAGGGQATGRCSGRAGGSGGVSPELGNTGNVCTRFWCHKWEQIFFIVSTRGGCSVFLTCSM